MMLDASDRRRFAEWCRERAAGNRGIVVGMKEINIPEAVIDRYQVEADALELVAKLLDSVEDM